MSKNKHCCSFCGRPVEDGSAGKVIAGMDNSLICEHCVEACCEMLYGNKKSQKASAPEKSCKIGNWVASKSIEGFGMEKFPTLKDLEEFF